jgi:hypothetical protein
MNAEEVFPEVYGAIKEALRKHASDRRVRRAR